MNAPQADELIKFINNEIPERWRAGIQTLVKDLYIRADKLEQKLNMVATAVVPLVQAAKGAPAEGAAAVEGAPAGEAPVEALPPAAAGDVPVGADGAPLTPEEAAREAQMDAAISGAPAPAPAALAVRRKKGA